MIVEKSGINEYTEFGDLQIRVGDVLARQGSNESHHIYIGRSGSQDTKTLLWVEGAVIWYPIDTIKFRKVNAKLVITESYFYIEDINPPCKPGDVLQDQQLYYYIYLGTCEKSGEHSLLSLSNFNIWRFPINSEHEGYRRVDATLKIEAL